MKAPAVSPPTRAVLNFTHKCALACEWCYVPFGTPAAERDVVKRIVDRLSFFGFLQLTLGGGDPFQYSFLPEIAIAARKAGLFVQIDTHGKSMVPNHLNERTLREAVQLVGLPLDGPTADDHDRMRSSPGHFDLLMRRFAWLKAIGTPVKINSMISAQNCGTLAALASVVSDLSPVRWSIYEFWPLGPAASARQLHSLQSSIFSAAASEAVAKVNVNTAIEVEVVAWESRRKRVAIPS